MMPTRLPCKVWPSTELSWTNGTLVAQVRWQKHSKQVRLNRSKQLMELKAKTAFSTAKWPIMAPFNPKFPIREFRYERVMWRFLMQFYFPHKIKKVKQTCDMLLAFEKNSQRFLTHQAKQQWQHQCHGMLANRVGALTICFHTILARTSTMASGIFKCL